MKLLICSSTCMSASGLNFGNYFSRCAHNGRDQVSIVTAPGLFHAFCATVELVLDDSDDKDLDYWEGVDIEVLGG